MHSLKVALGAGVLLLAQVSHYAVSAKQTEIPTDRPLNVMPDDFLDGSTGYWHIYWSDLADSFTCGGQTVSMDDISSFPFTEYPVPQDIEQANAVVACTEFDPNSDWANLNPTLAVGPTADSQRGVFYYQIGDVIASLHCIRDSDIENYGDGLYCCKGESTYHAGDGVEQYCDPAGPAGHVPKDN